ncbi:MAG: hypothetical protein M1817_001407 [Caeruleum heppii]|nr:MAG: hypothetical protein M1817_001407 [Caeruleum heppii]
MLDHLTATDEVIVDYCRRNRTHMIGGHKHGNIVLRISDEAVVKFGFGVTPEEAANQRFAFETFNGAMVRIPRVLRYFRETFGKMRPIGYLIMEFLDGQNLASVSQEELPRAIGSVAEFLSQLSQSSSNRPGPVHGGEPQGHLWTEQGARTRFHTLEDIEGWLNKRLAMSGESIDLRHCQLSFCHLDLARRNFLLRQDGSICVLDWASAGYYPTIFETCCMYLLLPWDPLFFEPLLYLLGAFAPNDEVLLRQLVKVYNANQVYEFEDMSDESDAILAAVPSGPPPVLPWMQRGPEANV